MITVLHDSDTHCWDPHSRRGEGLLNHRSRKRRDLWFFIGILAFAILLFFVWQQHRGLRLADEVAHLEARTEAMRTRLVEAGVEVTRLRQPDHLLGSHQLASLNGGELERRVFVPVQSSPEAAGSEPARNTWLASVGLEVPRALAADRP